MPEHRITWSLIALAVLARVAAVLVLQSYTVPNSTYEHGTIAANLLAGRGFTTQFLGAEGPTSQQAPVYPCLVAAAYALGGVGTPRALLILELGQAVLGGALVTGVMRLAREVLPERSSAAWVAGLIVGAHPTLVYAATHVQVALLAATLLTWTLASAYRLARTGDHAPSTGLWLALLMLTDPILGLAGVGVAWVVILGRGIRGAVRPLAVIGLVVVAALVPWTLRNYEVHGEFVAVKSTFGYAFWQGNCARSEGTDKVIRPSVERALERDGKRSADLREVNVALWRARHEAGYLDDIVLTAADYRALGTLSEPARSRQLFRRALDDLRAEPARYPMLCLRRLRYFVLFDETNPKTRSLIYRVPHLALTMLAGLGLALATRDVRRRLAPTIATAVLIAAFHTLTIVSARFHIPIEPLLALWAACGACRFGRRSPP